MTFAQRAGCGTDSVLKGESRLGNIPIEVYGTAELRLYYHRCFETRGICFWRAIEDRSLPARPPHKNMEGYSWRTVGVGKSLLPSCTGVSHSVLQILACHC